MIRPPEPNPVPEPLVPGWPADIRRWVLEVARTVLFVAALYLVLNTFVVQPVEVEMRSMQPLLVEGDHLLVDRLSLRWDAPDRGEVVVFDAPSPYGDDGVPYVKRVIGLPGETIQIENGRIYVSGPDAPPFRLDEPYLTDGTVTLPQGPAGSREWRVPEGSVFVLGDNRSDSLDSRTFGPIGLDRLIGRALVRYLPLDRIGFVSSRD
ncbi:MAG TPA: signal peptidase I [Candidatus Limnocylindria bacterium]|nr:signal peptidase I [Candidatus Limnocylindria bacterium]